MNLPIEIAQKYAQAAFEDGAYVITPDGKTVPIPPIATPLVLPRARMRQVSADAHAITASLVKLTARVMQAPSRGKLFAGFGPLEKQALESGWRQAEHLATVRVDFLVDERGRHRALEVNATIPAMQGYSDAIAAAYLRALARWKHLDGEKLVAANGRNTDDLLRSLEAHYTRLTGKDARGLTIAIVAREGDAQRGELEHYRRRWTSLGHEVLLVAPGEVRIENDRGVVGGVAPDLFYRHVFARRLDPDGDFARMCLRAPHFRVINPIASHLEDKAMLGLLSAAVAGTDDIGLTDEEKDAIARTVPWTRVLGSGAAIGPGGERIDDLAGWARENGSALVLKRAWDYGGKGVFLGADLESPSTQARVQALLGRAGGWRELVDHALSAADAWVVQELVRAQPMKQVRVGPSGLEERELYLDLSAFTNLGVEPRPAGGAVRGAESRIVNILGGGGLAPLVLEEVLATALT